MEDASEKIEDWILNLVLTLTGLLNLFKSNESLQGLLFLLSPFFSFLPLPSPPFFINSNVFLESSLYVKFCSTS